MKRILRFPIFLFLLPIFFVLHGYMENYDFVPVPDALLLTGIYMAFAIVFMLLWWLLFRDFNKAAIAAGYMMAVHFFFGSVHDTIRKISETWFPAKYSFILPFLLIVFIVLIIVLKRKKFSPRRSVRYLNIILLIFIAIDLAQVAVKAWEQPTNKSKLPAQLSDCPDCPRPDIYFIIADEYIGNRTLREQFNYDNTPFINELATRGFHTIPFSKSNYNYTPFSIASTMNMDYLKLGNTRKKRNESDLAVCFQTIRDNRLLHFLQYEGYRFFNFSMFDFEGQPPSTQHGFLPVKTKLITGQTLITRLNRDLRYHLITNLNSESELRKHIYGTLANNTKNYELTMKAAAAPSDRPKFVFTHLHIPHYPYFFDRNGKPNPFEKLLEDNQMDKDLYLEYLRYGNGEYLRLIDHILKTAKTPPIIILMGDHGFRHFREELDPAYLYLNHNSILLPGKQYAAFNDSLTNVNFFRVFLNTEFRQQLPMLRDTAYRMHE